MRESEPEMVADLFGKLGVTVEIIRQVQGIVSVTYNVAPKPPSTIEAV